MKCPCGLPKPLSECCGRFHRGEPPALAVELMRARFSAYALGDADFLLRTEPKGDRSAIERALRTTRWVRLDVERADAGGAQDEEGFVSFSACFTEGGQWGMLHERSRFERHAEGWLYVSGETRVEPFSLERNDPCPCGSGQKAKKCHLIR